ECRHQHITLPDAARDGLAGIPRLAKCRAFPFGVGHDALFQPRQLALIGLTETELAAGHRQSVNAEPLDRLVEITVARGTDGFVQRDRTVTAGLPAMEEVIAELHAAAADNALLGLDDACREAGKRRHHLESRAWRIEPANGAGIERVVGRIGNLRPGFGIDVEADGVRI